MKWLHVLVFAVFAGVALADTRCLYLKLIDHSMVFMTSLGAGVDFCTLSSQMVNNLDSSARECEIESNPEVREIHNVWTDICKDGTDLNKMYLEHKDCVFKTLPTGVMECMKFKDVGDPTAPDFKETILKKTCEMMEDTVQCGKNKMNEKCGSEAGEFFNKFQGPSIKVQKQACIDSGYGGVSAPSASILFCLLQVSAVIGLFKWFSD